MRAFHASMHRLGAWGQPYPGSAMCSKGTLKHLERECVWLGHAGHQLLPERPQAGSSGLDGGLLLLAAARAAWGCMGPAQPQYLTIGPLGSSNCAISCEYVSVTTM
jgi:hypothetical protein